MSPNRVFAAACAVIASWTSPAGAQPQADPADPAARVPTATYSSPFAGYRALGDEAVGDWRAANEEVGRIGGWREYARESQAPEAGSTAPETAPAQSVREPSPPGGHGGHPMPGGKQ